MEDDTLVEASSSNIKGKFKCNCSILCRSSDTVTTIFGLESWIWLESSETVYKGLQVVAIAPMETTAKKQTGKRIELGANSKTTSPRWMPRRSKERERVVTWALS